MDKLIKLLHSNFEKYRENLLLTDNKTIFDKSYETAIKYEIANFCEFDLLNEKILNELMDMNNPLEFLYQEYLESDNVNIVNELNILFENL